jgi:vesicle transport protein SEC22
MSSQLASDSRKYAKDAKNLNLQALYRKYGPPVIVLGVVLVVLYIRFWWF